MMVHFDDRSPIYLKVVYWYNIVLAFWGGTWSLTLMGTGQFFYSIPFAMISLFFWVVLAEGIRKGRKYSYWTNLVLLTVAFASSVLALVNGNNSAIFGVIVVLLVIYCLMTKEMRQIFIFTDGLSEFPQKKKTKT